jgi:hypothetical protein
MQKSQCPLCRETFEIEAEWIGQQAQCPFCQQMITIQSPSQLITHPGTIPGTTNITTEENPPQKSTASLVLGIVGCIAWLIPLIGFPVTIVGLILGIRRKYTVGIILNVIWLSLTLVNSAVGAVLGYRGKLF